MPFILHTEGLDEEPEDTPFETKEEAINAGVKWFEEGYEGYAEEYYRPEDRQAFNAQIRKDVENLRSYLSDGREFYCSRFYETVRITECS